MSKNRVYIAVVILMTVFIPFVCRAEDGGKKVKRYKVTVEKTYPHDVSSYTQGLFFHDGRLYESAGQYGRSRFFISDHTTGKATKNINIDARYFAEGACIVDGKLFVLTWQEHECLVYDPSSLRYLGSFRYSGEGWGLTTDGTSLIMSDGTSRLRFINPSTFLEERSVNVTLDGKNVTLLNELEYIKGEIWANIYTTDTIARIDPATGEVKSLLDCSGLLKLYDRKLSTDVLNGIAYNPDEDAVYLTGKYWPKLFKIKKIW